LIISNDISLDFSRTANFTIDSDANVISSETSFTAGRYVELLPEFEVSMNAVLIAKIEACP